MIRELTLLNFKCFEDQRFEFAPLTLLTGQNAMGKSSVMQALLLLRQSANADMLPHDGLLLDGEYVHLGAAVDALCDTARGEYPDSISFSLRFENAEDLYFRFSAADKQADVLPVEECPLDLRAEHPGSLLAGRSRATSARVPWSFQYLAAERLGPRDTHPLSSHHVDVLRDLSSDGSFSVAYLESHGTNSVEPLMRHPNAASEQLLSQATAWLGEVSPGVRVATRQHRELSLAALSISFASGTARSRSLRPTGVGFGLSYTLPVIVALLGAKPGDLVLLENPEAHLHPRGQMAMGELMARAAAAGVQLLVETHSDHVLNGVRVSVKRKLLAPEALRLHYFSRSSAVTQDVERIVHRVESPQIDADGRIDRWPDGFFDQWDIALDELL